MSFQKPQEQTLEQKIAECKEVIIQNMEKTMQHKMVFIYLKDNKLDGKIRNFSLNTKDGFIKIEFNEASQAKDFYEKYNFQEKILIRPFNIYYNLQLNDNEMKKYYIEGITEENQRKVFEAAMRIGPLKLYTHYNNFGTSSRKLKPKGILSFIRKEEVPFDLMENLTKELKALDIKISPYVADKGLKCSVSIYNFFNGNSSEEDTKLAQQAEEQVRNLIKGITDDPTTTISINIKRKEDKENKDAIKVSATALLEYSENEITMKNFELLRKALVNKGDTKAVLFFHNHENNSYFSLYTSGLDKKEDMTDKQFEDLLLNTYQKVNKNVVQVNVFPVTYNKTFVGRIYLNSEEAGKNFIVDYPTRREELIKVYKDANSINFNINVDAKTLKKIKQNQKKATDIAKHIKNTEEQAKKSRNQKRPANTNPLGDVPMGRMPIMGGFNPPMPGGVMINSSNPMQQKLPMGGMPPMMGMNSGMMGPGMGSGMVGIGSGMPQPGMAKDMGSSRNLEQMLRDKQKFLKMDLNTAKRLILPFLKFSVEKMGVNSAESGAIAERILKEDLQEVFRLLENEDELKRKIGK